VEKTSSRPLRYGHAWPAGRTFAAVGVVAVAAIVLVTMARPSPQLTKLAAGAEPLGLLIQPNPALSVQPGGCPTAQIQPVRVARSGSSLIFVSADDGAVERLAWPSGFSARLVDGRGELVTPAGSVFAKEGDVLSQLIGSAADNGDLLVCFASAAEYESR
jgi:hypothetical protein